MAAMKNLNLLTFSLLLIFSLLTTTNATITHGDLESALTTLRSSGYNLFANSIAVSDLSFQILSLSSTTTSTTAISAVSATVSGGFTLLAPPNSALFSLDMSANAFTYVHSLRFHVIPRRLTFSDLRNLSLSSSPHLETLVPGHNLFVASSYNNGGAGDVISIDGVRVSFPDLYIGPEIAAHGLDGVLASSTEEYFHGSISMPPVNAGFSPVNAGFSPESDGIPAISPSSVDFSISPSDEKDFLSPRVSPFIERFSLPPVEFVPSPENFADDQNYQRRIITEQSQGQGQSHGQNQILHVLAKYRHSSSSL